MHHTRWRRATTAAVASLCASAAFASAAHAAQGDLPRITQNAPTGISMNFWDDHSLGGDDHLGWSHGDAESGYSEGEPLAISFQASVNNDGPGVLQLCSSATGTTWRTARQTAPASLGDCSGAGVNAGDMFFRYAIANHSSGTDFNRWHTMDFQRFALVPLTANGQGADTSRPTVWDNQWGTCLLDDDGMACPQDQNGGAFGVGISAGTHNKLTQEGAPDQALIAFRSLDMLAEGTNRYQVVAISNPYGAIRENGTTSGSVNCTDVQITTNHELGTFSLTQVGGQPANCFLPRTLQSPVTGAGGVDPFAGATVDQPCVLHSADEVTDPTTQGPGHCWLTIPTTNSGLASPHPLARSNVSDARAATATSVTAVTPGSAVRSTGGGDNSGGNTGGGNNGNNGGGTVTVPKTTTTPPTTVIPNPQPQPKSVPTLEVRAARSYTRAALRKVFGTLPSSAKVTCRLTGGASSACTVSWHRADHRRYSGSVRVWFTSTATQVRWNYDVNVKRTLRGHTTITKRTRAGGTVA